MKRVLFVALLALSACIPPKPPQPPQPPPPQTVTVAAVVHDQLGAPIAGARLSLDPNTVAYAPTNADGYSAAQVIVGSYTLTATTDCCGVATSPTFNANVNQNVNITVQRPAPPTPTWTKTQKMDIQGDLMIWAPEVGCQSAETGIRCNARGLQDGWVWTLSFYRYGPANRQKLYNALGGKTHVAIQAACDGGQGYHDLYPEDCVNYGKRNQVVIDELHAAGKLVICAGISSTAKLADGLDPSTCDLAMDDWDNTCDKDAGLRAIGNTFPRSTLLYVELPAWCDYPKLDPGTVPISVPPDPSTGGHWIMGAQKAYPNFVGMLYETNLPDGLDANIAQLKRGHPWWRDIQEVGFELDTYQKFWDGLTNDAARAYNDNLMKLAPWLKGCMSGCTTHPVIPDVPVPSGDLGTSLDMHEAVIEHDDPGMTDWNISTTITGLDLLPSGVHVEFSKADGPNRWPDTPDYSGSGGMGPLQYSIGLCFKISGQWHCSAPIELWYGLHENGGNIGEPGQVPSNWFYDNRWGAMQGYQPKAGEIVGVYVVAGDARNNIYVVKERSNIVLVPFPTAAGAKYR